MDATPQDFGFIKNKQSSLYSKDPARWTLRHTDFIGQLRSFEGSSWSLGIFITVQLPRAIVRSTRLPNLSPAVRGGAFAIQPFDSDNPCAESRRKRRSSSSTPPSSPTTLPISQETLSPLTRGVYSYSTATQGSDLETDLRTRGQVSYSIRWIAISSSGLKVEI
ncbi:hypothetical protein C8Q75DRAFT_736868 [Abortiporus biennis]|nr:hypothetical protein C8Q75DRAFT_736868 [Abortiporus biennis]